MRVQGVQRRAYYFCFNMVSVSKFFLMWVVIVVSRSIYSGGAQMNDVVSNIDYLRNFAQITGTMAPLQRSWGHLQGVVLAQY